MNVFQPVIIVDDGDIRWPPDDFGDAEFKSRLGSLKKYYDSDRKRIKRMFRVDSASLFVDRVSPEQIQEHRKIEGDLIGKTNFELQKMITDYEVRNNDSPKIIAESILSIRFSTDPCCLFCEQTKKQLDFKKENQKATVLIRAALQGDDEIGGWIDNSNNFIGQSLPGRKLYDAGKQINKRARKDLDLKEDLFIVDSHNNQVKLNMKATTFKIVQ